MITKLPPDGKSFFGVVFQSILIFEMVFIIYIIQYICTVYIYNIYSFLTCFIFLFAILWFFSFVFICFQLLQVLWVCVSHFARQQISTNCISLVNGVTLMKKETLLQVLRMRQVMVWLQLKKVQSLVRWFIWTFCSLKLSNRFADTRRNKKCASSSCAAAIVWDVSVQLNSAFLASRIKERIIMRSSVRRLFNYCAHKIFEWDRRGTIIILCYLI